MLKEIKAAIFDLDGTLVDSMWVWKAVDVEYVEKYQLKEPEGFYRAIEGMSFIETARYYCEVFPQLNQSPEEIKQEWLDMVYEKYRTEVALKGGVKEFLQHLKAQGVRMGIATSNVPELAKTVLEAHGILGYFDTICTACDVKGKPAPDVYLKAAKELEVEPKHCLVFEDVPNGIMAGKNAGMHVCAIEDTNSEALYGEKVELADYYIKDYRDILNNIYESTNIFTD